jgi:putative oxidoreductase
MNDADAVDVALLLLRLGLGAVMLAHGINHAWGGAGIRGTARWFGSMGMRPPLVQAWMSAVTEIVGGVCLVLGLLTPFGCAAVVGVMTVAWAINHRGNGFFIFRPGEGWEYVMTLAIAATALGALGPGSWSVDDALDIADDLSGTTGLAIAAGAGIGGAALLLALCWRPVRPSSSSPATGS